jgi:hypothetical protein
MSYKTFCLTYYSTADSGLYDSPGSCNAFEVERTLGGASQTRTTWSIFIVRLS